MKEQEVKGSLQTGSALKEEACFVFTELVDYLITDVATEAHRAARLGFDYRLDIEEEEEARLSAQARTATGDPTCSGAETNCKYTVDVFGQSHPVIASEAFDCMNCGRSIVAGRFAPHLEKCMGKLTIISSGTSLLVIPIQFRVSPRDGAPRGGLGRRARLKNFKTTSNLVPQQKRARGSPGSSHGASTYSQGLTGNRSHNKQTVKEASQSAAELNDETSDEVHDDEEKVRRARLQAGHCQVSA